MADVFVSYSRRDSDFVSRLSAALDVRGKDVWVDTGSIADAEVFPQAIRSAIEASDAFLFVITPEAVASAYCEQEVGYAGELGKRIVPVLRHPVPDSEIPVQIRERNWIPFTDEAEFDTATDRVVQALDTDLDHRKEHTRWLVKSIEWDGEGRDKSFLLHGSELKAAENWLAGSPADADPSPTTLQSEYVLASRRAATRRGRSLLAVSGVVTVVAIGLGVIALVSRNQAVSVGNTARAQALAAESQNELTADPEVSVLLARQAMAQRPVPQAVAALRQAMDSSPVRVALPTQSVGTCAPSSGPSIAYSPSGHRVAEVACNDDVVVLDSASGHVVYRKRLPASAGAVAYDPGGRVLAVGTNAGILLLDPSTGAVRSRLALPAAGGALPRGVTLGPAPGGPNGPGPNAQRPGAVNALAFNDSGTELAATTFFGTTAWDVRSGQQLFSLAEPGSDQTAAFTTDGTSLVVGTTGAPEVVDVATGQVVQRLTPPGQTLAGQASPVAIRGVVLAVGENVTGPGDVSAYIDLWDTKTWTMFDTLTPVNGTAVGDVSISPDGQRVAVGNYDGTGGVWSILPDEELVSLAGQTADLNAIAFNPSGTDVVTAANDGTARIYRASGPWLATLKAQLCGCGNEIGWQPHKVEALARSGNDMVLQAWSLPQGRPVPHPLVLNTDQQDVGAVLSGDGTLAATWNESGQTSAVTVQDTTTGRTVFTLPATTVGRVSLSTDDRLMLVTDGNGRLHVTNLATRRTVVGSGWSESCNASYNPPAVSDNDRLVAVYSFCGQVQVGRVATARPFETFDQHAQLSSAAFNAAGTRLALGSWADTVTVLNVTTDKPVLEIVGHTRGVNGVVYGSRDRYIITTSTDDTMRVWNAATGQLLQVDRDVSSPGAPSVSPDGALAAETNNDNQVRVWAVCPDCQDPAAILKASRSSVVSPLTSLERAEAASQAG
ncbi:MAG TPA: TIR domain-containing protein [Acidimicrobiales bacterium]|nr:TIR domain-containing protein [Acidimicrobiales bacterium]